ncbi:MAG: lysophospholipid acyltransferase family protein [PVC group bacterium]|nr:lysophospholipid acyltransferase family protein [PVC group bacterium]
MKKIIRIIVSWIGYFGFKFLIYVIKHLPHKIVYSCGSVLSSLYYVCARRNRQLALRNIRLALGDELSLVRLNSVVRESFKTMGQVVLDTIRFKDLPKEKIRDLIAVEGFENFKKAVEGGKGVIVVSAHMGSFSLVAKRLTIEGHKASFVARHMRDKKMEKVLVKLCREAGQKIIFNSPIVAFYRRCIRSLAKNESVIIELDQNFGTEGIPLSFFGRQAMVAPGPIVLSIRTEAPILPMFIVKKKDNTHVLKIEPAIELSFTDDADKDMRNNLQKIIDVIEAYIRRYPGQWVNWIHKRWDVGKESKS